MTIGQDVARAFKAAEPEAVAMALYKNLFEQPGGGRLSAEARHMALSAFTAGLREWRDQLRMEGAAETAKYKSLYEAAKAELDVAKLHVALCNKEHGGTKVARGW